MHAKTQHFVGATFLFESTKVSFNISGTNNIYVQDINYIATKIIAYRKQNYISYGVFSLFMALH